MLRRMKRTEEFERMRANKKEDSRTKKVGVDGKQDTEFGAYEVPDEIPAELKTGRGKVKAADTAEGVIGDVSDPEKDPMRVDKKY